MLEETIAIYHERRKHISAEEAGATQEQASEDIIKNATEQALQILRQMNESRESFRKIGLTFEEKAFYDILVSLRDQYNFEYGEDKEIGGMIVNDKCKILAKKVKEIIDTKSSFSDPYMVIKYSIGIRVAEKIIVDFDFFIFSCMTLEGFTQYILIVIPENP